MKIPEGFVEFKWKNKVFDKGRETEYTAQLCPNCGDFGFLWQGPYSQDKERMSVLRLSRKKGFEIEGKLKDWIFDVDFRACYGECLNCKCRLWNNFLCTIHEKDCSLHLRGCNWKYAYKPNPVCKWNGKRLCRLAEYHRVSAATGRRIRPFECCSFEKADEILHCECQPTVMGYGSREEFLKDNGEIIQKDLEIWFE